MKFNEFEYKRPNLEEIKIKINELKDKFEISDVKGQVEIIREYFRIADDFETNSSLVSVRYSLNTNDAFYEKESEFMDENTPLFSDITKPLEKLILNSKYKDELIKEFGDHYFKLLEYQDKTFNPEAIPLFQEENKLVNEYNKFIANAKFFVDGKDRTISELAKYTSDPDREVRKSTFKVIAKYWKDHMEEIDTLYDNMVKVRDKIAKVHGFDNFMQYTYTSMLRTDYTPEDVKGYRESIRKFITPLYTKLLEQRRERLGYDKIYMYDTINFLSGNARPKGNEEWLVQRAKEMYEDLSKETGEFFNTMVNRNLLDLTSRFGKMSGGYCTSFNNYKVPFIFANFNETAHDVTVLTHEAGHAFQVYQAFKKIDIPAYLWPTYESCEIHSMSMEFITWPYMNKFFLEDTEKFKYEHLADALMFIPYGVTVDEFQEYVYTNVDATPEQRRMKWLEIEKKYKPTLEYGEIEDFELGTFWYKQGHIFSSPFYYIDYTLAQVCAFQFLINSLKDREKTWNTYVSLCKLGGSKPFTKLIESAGLLNPFKDGVLENISNEINEILKKFKI